jgi:hypothetical protein
MSAPLVTRNPGYRLLSRQAWYWETTHPGGWKTAGWARTRWGAVRRTRAWKHL